MTRRSDKPVIVPVVLNDSANLAGETTIRIPAGATSGAATITINDDSINEPGRGHDYNKYQETHTLTMGMPRNALPGEPDAISFNVKDDDPIIRFGDIYTGVSEGKTPSIIIHFSGFANEPIPVYFDVQPISATEDADYAVTKDSIEIALPTTEPSGTGYITLPIDVLDDDIVEGTESLVVQMVAPGYRTAGGNTLEVAVLNAVIGKTLFIQDNDIQSVHLVFPDSNSSRLTVGEGVGAVPVTIRLSHPYDEPKDVLVGLPEGTISTADGSDYSLSQEQFHFPAGVQSQTFHINVKDDDKREFTQTVKIAAIVDGLLSETAVLSIADNDSPVTAVIPHLLPGTLAISQDFAPTFEGNVATSFPPLGPISGPPDVLPPGSLAIYTGLDGFISGGLAFFDGNNNGVLDFIDLNGNGIQEANEATEPSAVTEADGSFGLAVPSVFDHNSNVRIDEYDGQVVLTAGIDSSTGMPLGLSLAAPGGFYSVTPVTTLVNRLVRYHGLSSDAAQRRVLDALGIPQTDLSTMNPIASFLNGDPIAADLVAAGAMLQDTVVQIAQLVSSTDDLLPFEFAADRAFQDMAAKLLEEGSSLNVAMPSVVESIISGTLLRTAATLDSEVISGAASVIAATNSEIAALNVRDPEAYLRRVTKTQVASQGEVADALAAVGAGEQSILTAEAQYTGEALQNVIAAAKVQNTLPPVIVISDVREIETEEDAIFEFAVLLLNESTLPVTVDYATADHSADQDDYQPASGTLTWEPGDNTSRTVQVIVNGDANFEADEEFLVILSNASNAAIRRDIGVGTIVNDDALTFYAPNDAQENHLELLFSSGMVRFVTNGTTVLEEYLSMATPMTIVGAPDVGNELVISIVGENPVMDAGIVFQGSASHDDVLAVFDGFSETVEHTVTDPSNGVFHIDGTVLSYCDVETVVDLMTPTLIGIPTAVIDEGTTLALGSTVADPDVTYEYAWTVIKDGDTENPYATGSEPSVEFTPNDNGEYVVTLTTSAPERATATVVHTVTVRNVPEVTSVLDVVDPDDGVITLREAILATNANPGLDTISFSIDGGGQQTIQLLSALPTITDPVVIDATTQPDYAGSPIIALDGGGTVHTGLHLTAGGSEVRGLEIDNFTSVALSLVGGDNYVIEDSRLGRHMRIGVNLVDVTDSTLRGLDASWTGAGTSGWGIRLNGSSGNTVENITATHRQYGAWQEGTYSDNVIQNSDFSGAEHTGIYASGMGTGNRYVDNDLSDIQGYYGAGVRIEHDHLFQVAGNDFTDSKSGLVLLYIDGVTITPDAVPGQAQASIDVSTVRHLGLAMAYVNNSTIRGLDLSWTGADTSGRGINLNNCSNNTIEDVSATNRQYGAFVEGTYSDNVIRTSDFSGAEHTGINAIGTGTGNSYLYNDLSNVQGYYGTGLVIEHDPLFRVVGNAFSDSKYGVSLRYIDAATISSEFVTGQAQASIDVSSVWSIGLGMANVNNSTIQGLDLSWSGGTPTGYGIYLSNSSNNVITEITATSRANAAHIIGTYTGNVIQSCDLSGSGGYGILAAGHGSANKYLNNNLANSAYVAIQVSADTQFEVAGNNFLDSRFGLVLAGLTGAVVTPDAVPGQARADIDVSTVSDRGLILGSVTNSTIRGLDLSWAGAGSSGWGVVMSHSHDNTIEDITATNRNTGLQFLYENRANTVQNSDFSGAVYGINFYAWGTGNRYFNNNLSNCTNTALSILNDNQAEIADNNFSGSLKGLLLYRMQDIDVSPSGGIDIDVSDVLNGLTLSDVTNATISGLDLSWGGATATGNGLVVSGGGNVTIDDVTVRNRRYGINVGSSSSMVEIRCSRIEDNETGIYVTGSATGIVVNDSILAGNTVYGVRNLAADEVNAEWNYWGSTDGPAPVGSGDTISSNVDADPFRGGLPACFITGLSAGGPYTVDEGSSVALAASFTPADPDPQSVQWDFNYDGVSFDVDATGAQPTFDASALDGPATRTVAVRVSDTSGQTDAATSEVTINNVAPVVDTGADQMVNEGDSVNFSGSFTDAGSADTHTATINWGDGRVVPFDPAASPVAGSHVYADNGSYTVTLAVTDDDGDVGSDTMTVTVLNVAPVVDAGADQTVDEGDSVNFAGSFTDAGSADTHTAMLDWGDGTIVPFDPATSPVAGSHVYADNGAYTVTLTVTDDDGDVGSDTMTVTVLNVAATLTTSGSPTVNEGSTYTLNLSSSDPGDDTISRWDIQWGDGTPGEVVIGNPSSVTHVYPDGPRTHTILATATDEDGTYSATATGGVQAVFDPGFGDGGEVIQNFVDSTGDYVRDSVIVQPDGKVLVAGYTQGGNNNIALARYLSNGSLDATFGDAGQVITEFGYHETAYSMVLDGSGNILIGGNSGLSRYSPDGVLDVSFGDQGQITTFGTGITKIALEGDPNGDYKILVGGSWRLGRLTKDGIWDGSFGTSGKAATEGYSYDFVQDANGKIVTSGYYRHLDPDNNWQYDLIVERYNTDGTLDTGFGTSGRFTFNNSSLDNSNFRDLGLRVAIHQDKILVGGYSGDYRFDPYAQSITRDIVLLRLTDAGALDTTFGSSGSVLYRYANHDYLYAMSVDSTDRIVVSGNNSIYRFAADGARETTLNSGVGRMYTSLSSRYSLAFDSGSDIYVGGSRREGAEGHNFAVERFNEDGTRDNSFGEDISTNYVTTDFVGPTADYLHQLTVSQSDGKILVAGYKYGGTQDIVLARYLPTGELDTTFGDGGSGITTTDFSGGNEYVTALAVSSDGSIYVGYSGYVVRYNGAGSLDAEFGSSGRFNTSFYVQSLEFDSDGKLLVGGYKYQSAGSGLPTTYDFAVARYTPSATTLTPDTSFDDDGIFTLDFNTTATIRGDQFAYDITVDANDRVIVVGGTREYDYATYQWGDYNAVILCLDTSGNLDATFGPSSDGVIVTTGRYASDYARNVVLDNEGRIVVGFSSYLHRYDSDGILDTTLDGDGVVENNYTVYSLQVDANDKLVGGGSRYLMRWNDDGSPDTDFAPNGRITTPSNRYINAIELDGANRIMVAGYTSGQGVTGVDYWLARFISEGLAVTVHNVAPQNLSIAGPGSTPAPTAADEGDTIELVASATDPAGPYDPLIYSWNITRNGADYLQVSGESISFDALDDGNYRATVTVNDGDGGVVSKYHDISVANVAPTATFNFPAAAVDEGSPINLSLSSPSDPSSVDTAAGFEYAFDFGDGYGAFSTTASAAFIPPDNGQRTVKGKIRDKDGGLTEYTSTVTVNNVAPTVDAGLAQTVDEGSVVSLDPSTFNDLGTLDSHTATIDWGDVTPADAGVVSESPFGPPGSTAGANGTVAGSHVYADNGVYTVTVTVTDDEGGVGTDTLLVTVNNVAPTVTSFTGPNPSPAVRGQTLDFSGALNDLGTLDTHTATIDWGDGSTVDAGVVTEAPFGPPGSTDGMDGTVVGSHVYTDAGDYLVPVDEFRKSYNQAV